MAFSFLSQVTLHTFNIQRLHRDIDFVSELAVHYSTAALHNYTSSKDTQLAAQLPTKVNQKTAVTTAALYAGAAWAGHDYD